MEEQQWKNPIMITHTQSMICYWCNNKTVVTNGANLTVIQDKGKVHRFVIAWIISVWLIRLFSVIVQQYPSSTWPSILMGISTYSCQHGRMPTNSNACEFCMCEKQNTVTCNCVICSSLESCYGTTIQLDQCFLMLEDEHFYSFEVALVCFSQGN